MQHLEVSGAVRPLKWSLGVKWLNKSTAQRFYASSSLNVTCMQFRVRRS